MAPIGWTLLPLRVGFNVLYPTRDEAEQQAGPLDQVCQVWGERPNPPPALARCPDHRPEAAARRCGRCEYEGTDFRALMSAPGAIRCPRCGAVGAFTWTREA
jgi:DNA-directed RNA polymerase subunit RPC12/RpoP